MSKTWTPKGEGPQRGWKILDASDQSLGRLASQTAQLLMGKGKAEFTPHVMGGDFVIIINSDKVRLTGKKWTQKTYYSKSRFIGSLKEKKAKDIPTPELIKKAVEGMLPKNSHRPRSLKRLKIFKDSKHTYESKNPEVFNQKIKSG